MRVGRGQFGGEPLVKARFRIAGGVKRKDAGGILKDKYLVNGKRPVGRAWRRP